jgi:hypothetical protein
MSARAPLRSVMRIQPPTIPCPPLSSSAGVLDVRSEAEGERAAAERLAVGEEAGAYQLLALGRAERRQAVTSLDRVAGQRGRQGVRIAAGGLQLLEERLFAELVGRELQRVEQRGQRGDGGLLLHDRIVARLEHVVRSGRQRHELVDRIGDRHAGDQADAALDASHGPFLRASDEGRQNPATS